MCISRFDEETRASILDLYTKVDAGVDLNEEVKEDTVIEDDILDTDADY